MDDTQHNAEAEPTYRQQTRRNAFCGACEAGVPHKCDAYDDKGDN